MSYDLELRNIDGNVAIVADGHDLRGGTYRVGGNDRAELNVTYNYALHFRRVLGDRGIRTLYGMTGRESVPLLSEAIDKLNTDTHPDYWTPTEGNARAALVNLRLLAMACPDAVWHGD